MQTQSFHWAPQVPNHRLLIYFSRTLDIFEICQRRRSWSFFVIPCFNFLQDISFWSLTQLSTSLKLKVIFSLNIIFWGLMAIPIPTVLQPHFIWAVRWLRPHSVGIHCVILLPCQQYCSPEYTVKDILPSSTVYSALW